MICTTGFVVGNSKWPHWEFDVSGDTWKMMSKFYTTYYTMLAVSSLFYEILVLMVKACYSYLNWKHGPITLSTDSLLWPSSLIIITYNALLFTAWCLILTLPIYLPIDLSPWLASPTLPNDAPHWLFPLVLPTDIPHWPPNSHTLLGGSLGKVMESFDYCQ